jgi:hypothetical protein
MGAVLACLVLLVGACSDLADLADEDAVKGSGTIVTETRAVEDFDAIEIVTSGDVTVEVSGRETLTIEADENILPLLTSSISGGQLVLSVRPNTRISPSQDVRYRITAIELNEFVVLGSGNVTITGVRADEFEVSVLGSAEMKLEGTTGALTISIPGSGTVDAQRLRASIAAVSINGSGSVVVDVSDELDASINGSGSINYLGTPTVRQSINGSGTVEPS